MADTDPRSDDALAKALCDVMGWDWNDRGEQDEPAPIFGCDTRVPSVQQVARDAVAEFMAHPAVQELIAAERADATNTARRHTLANDENLRVLHANAKAYWLAVAAYNQVVGAPLHTTLAFLIEQGYLIPANPHEKASDHE